MCRWIGVLTTVLLAACGNSTTGPSEAATAVAGIYALATINGSTPPALSVPSPPSPCPGTMNAGTLTLKTSPQQTYDLLTSTVLNCTLGGSVRFDNTGETGQWSISGATITFKVTGGDSYHLTTGTLNGTTLTIRFDAPHQNAGSPNFSISTSWHK